MSKCPYTWFKTQFNILNGGAKAANLRVSVSRKGKTTVDVSLPSSCARRLTEVIPDHIISKIKNEGIPIEAIEEDFKQRENFQPQPIFTLEDFERLVKVWLE